MADDLELEHDHPNASLCVTCGWENVLDGLEGRSSSEVAGHATGFHDLDTLTNGLMPGTLTVLASRPSIGRTTLLSDIVRRTAIKDGTPVAVFTLEETRRDFLSRVLAAEARVALFHMASGTMSEEDWAQLARRMGPVAEAPLHVRAPARMTLADLAEQAAADAAERGVRLIALDGIQDVKPDKRSDLREREVGDIVRGLKTLARELDVAVLATSHLNRGPEQRPGRRPRLDDLRESGAVTYAADTIVLIHREDAYERESPRAGEADLIVAKHRHGPEATLTVAFQGHYGRFVDLAPS